MLQTVYLTTVIYNRKIFLVYLSDVGIKSIFAVIYIWQSFEVHSLLRECASPLASKRQPQAPTPFGKKTFGRKVFGKRNFLSTDMWTKSWSHCHVD